MAISSVFFFSFWTIVHYHKPKDVTKSRGARISPQCLDQEKGKVIPFLSLWSYPHPTVVQRNQELGCMYWAIRTSVRSFARIAHSFACSAVRPAHFILALHCGAALNRKLAHLLTHSRACGNMNDIMYLYRAILNHSVPPPPNPACTIIDVSFLV